MTACMLYTILQALRVLSLRQHIDCAEGFCMIVLHLNCFSILNYEGNVIII